MTTNCVSSSDPDATLRLPVPNPTQSFWHTELHELANHRTTPDLPSACDFLIIGSGYAGTSVAYNLVQAAPQSPNSVVVLEARQACSGATGRNGGHLRPDVYGYIPRYLERYGLKAGKQWAEYEVSHLQAIKELIEKEAIDCDFILTRATDAWCNEEAAKRVKANYDFLKSQHFPFLNDVSFIDGPRAAGISGVKDAKVCASYTTGTLWPYKFITSLLSKALASGKLNLQTNTPVTSIHTNPDGTLTVSTPRGNITAQKVVHASNAYISSLLPEYSQSIVPCKGICTYITVPEGKPAPYIGSSYCVWDKNNVSSYLIRRHDGSIIVGGSSQNFRPYRDQWYNNTDDSNLIDASKTWYDGFMQRTFAGWEDSEASVKHIWTGVMGYSWDSLPHFGEVPGRPGQYVLAGMNGHGMPVIWHAAKGIADMVATGKTYEETGLPWIAKTTEERIRKAQLDPEGSDIFLKVRS